MLLGETYVRLTKEYITPEMMRKRSLEYAPSVYARHAFPLKEQIINERGYYINAKGYRGNDFNRKKGDATIRVMVYGGSAAFDQNVPNGKDWPSRLEHLLKEKGLLHIEVINAGIPAHRSIDSFGRLFTEGHIFEPDYIILYNAWNDIKYFSFEEPFLRIMGSPYDPSRDYRRRYQGALDQVLCEFSQLYVRLRERYYSRKYKVGHEGAIQNGENNRKISEVGLRQYRLNVEMFVELAKSIQAVPILVKQARLVAHDNTNEDKSRIKYNYQKMTHDVLLTAFEKNR